MPRTNESKKDANSLSARRVRRNVERAGNKVTVIMVLPPEGYGQVWHGSAK